METNQSRASFAGSLGSGVMVHPQGEAQDEDGEVCMYAKETASITASPGISVNREKSANICQTGDTRVFVIHGD